MRLLILAAFVCGVFIASNVRGQQLSNVINPGTTNWVNAATTGRADMLVLGDSVTWFGGHGWDQGMTYAANNRLGLAGTGLITDSGVTGQGLGFSAYGASFFNNGWDTTLAGIPAAQQGYALRTGGVGVTAGATPLSNFGYGVTGTTLNPSSAYDWSVYSATPQGGGQIGAYRRIGTADSTYTYNTLQTITPVALSPGQQTTVFHFNATPTISGYPEEMFLNQTTNTSILYSRLTVPGATGVTVSSLGLGGQNTEDFYNKVWTAMSPQGRAAYMTALTDGGSGKLNVMIAEGFNDRNSTAASLNGTDANNTPAGFRANLTTLMSSIRSAWAANGKPADDLSFTLVGMYQDASEAPDGTGSLHALATGEMAIAMSDPQVSFVDLYDQAPAYLIANSLGYLQDSTHPTLSGADAYSSIVVDSLTSTPEPASVALVALFCVGLLLRRPFTPA